jgi:hypothetical protein
LEGSGRAVKRTASSFCFAFFFGGMLKCKELQSESRSG